MITIDANFSQLVGWGRDLQHDINLLQNLLNDRVFLDELTQLIEESYEEIWDTEGGAIGEDWNGNTLVDTGNLKMAATKTLDVTVSSSDVFFTVNIPYASFVNDLYKFNAITPDTPKRVEDLIKSYLARYGKLAWS